MALPLAPIALFALRYGAVAAATYAVVRRAQRSDMKDLRSEHAHEDAPEGVNLRHHRDERSSQMDANARFKRTIRLGRNGPGVEVDASALGRIKIRKADRS